MEGMSDQDLFLKKEWGDKRGQSGLQKYMSIGRVLLLLEECLGSGKRGTRNQSDQKRIL